MTPEMWLMGGTELVKGAIGLFDVGMAALNKFGFFGENVAARQIASITRVSSDVANQPFMTDEALSNGWNPPYPPNLSLRQITTGSDLNFIRFFSGNDPEGAFLVRESEVSPILGNPEQLKVYLGLKDVPIYMTDVNVPANTEMLVGRIGSQPNFGLMNNSGFQYQLLQEIPEESFTNIRPILRLNDDLTSNYTP